MVVVVVVIVVALQFKVRFAQVKARGALSLRFRNFSPSQQRRSALIQTLKKKEKRKEKENEQGRIHKGEALSFKP